MMVDNLGKGGYLHLTRHVRTWGLPGDGCIAACECAMLFVFMWEFRHELRNRRVLWLVDNSASLFAVIKGSSNSPSMTRTIELIHFVMYHFHIQVWWEFVASEQNFSDGISRLLGNDPFAASHQFHTHEIVGESAQVSWWKRTLHELWNYIERAALGVGVSP